MIILFLTSFFTCLQIHIVHVWGLVQGREQTLSCLLAQSSFFFCLNSNVFSFTMCTKLGLPHLLALGLSHYIDYQSLNPMGIHLLCCTHGKEKTTSHDVMWNAFAITTLVVSSRPRQGLAKVRVESEARESHFMLSGM
jgi:hypothetical protein